LPSRLSNKAARLIDGKNFGFLATIMPDGSPQVSPVWIDREGDLVLVNTAVGCETGKRRQKPTCRSLDCRPRQFI